MEKLRYERLGAMLAIGRAAAGYDKQSDFASRLNVSQQSVSRWEAGTHRPRAQQIELIAQLLGLQAPDLMQLAGYVGVPSRAYVEPFPVDRLSPETYESFLAYVLQMLHPDAHVLRAGKSGHTQAGIDIDVQFKDGRRLGVQCKRVEQFGPTDVLKSMAAVTAPVTEMALALSRVASPQAAEVFVGRQDWKLWDKDYLSRLIRSMLSLEQQMQLVDLFFHGRRLELLGIDEPGPWRTTEKFFEPFEGKERPFNHSWDLVARAAEIDKIAEFMAMPTGAAIIVVAPGGMGKTRFLRAAIERIDSENPGRIVRFLSSGSEVRKADLEALGPGPKLIVVDDAHDRENFGPIFEFAAARSHQTKLILASRPYAELHIKREAAKQGLITFEKLELPRLSKDQLVAIAADALKAHGIDSYWAEQLATFSNSSPIVVTMGAQVLAKEPRAFEQIKDDEGFREFILLKFPYAITGDLGGGDKDRQYKDVLETLALVQPFHADDPQLLQMLQELKRIERGDAAAIIRRFAEGGIIFKRGSQYRLMPDVLGDYLVETSCLDLEKRLSPFAIRALELASNKLLINALVNLGRLDWRLSNGVSRGSSLLTHVWESFYSIENEWDGRWGAIQAVAVYQPEQALNLVAHFVRRGKIFLGFPEILRQVAYSGQYYQEVLEFLWRLGQVDEREQQRFTNHPLRILTDLAGYDIRKPFFFSIGVLEFGVRLCQNDSEWSGKNAPIELLKPLMSTEGVHTISTQLTITMAPFTLEYDQVKPYRAKVIDVAIGLLQHTDLRIAFAAAAFLDCALHWPMGLMNSAPEVSVYDAYDAEFAETIDRLTNIIAAGVAPLVAIELGRKVTWLAQHGRPKSKPAAQRLLDAIEPTPAITVRRLLAGAYVDIIDDDVGPWSKRVEARAAAIAADLKNAWPNHADLIAYIDGALHEFAIAKAHSNSHVLMTAIVRGDHALSCALLNRGIAEPSGSVADFVGIALNELYRLAPEEATGRAETCMATGDSKLKRQVAQALCFLDAVATDHDVAIVKELLADSDVNVACAAIQTLTTWRSYDMGSVVELVLDANVNGSPILAEEIATAIFVERSDDALSHFSAGKVRQLLDLFGGASSLNTYQIGRIISSVSYHFPRETFEFLVNRVEYAADHENQGVSPFTHGRTTEERLRFSETAAYAELVMKMFAWLRAGRDKNYTFQYHAVELFASMFMENNRQFVQLLEAHINFEDANDLRLAIQILRKVWSNFIFDEDDFVVRFLGKCQGVDEQVYDDAVGALGAATTSGMRSGVYGQPTPRDVQDFERAKTKLETMSRLSPGYRLYDYIRKHAKSSIDESLQIAEAVHDD